MVSQLMFVVCRAMTGYGDAMSTKVSTAMRSMIMFPKNRPASKYRGQNKVPDGPRD